jgi:hypothetical protein
VSVVEAPLEGPLEDRGSIKENTFCSIVLGETIPGYIDIFEDLNEGSMKI